MNILNIFFKILLSIGCGFCLGKERKKHDKSAGSRTMSLVCMSACLVAILSIELYNTYNTDFMRLMAYLIAGISFIGNGVIVKKKNQVDGLTTSSSLLIAVILGFLVGLGYYLIFFISSLFVYCILESKYWFKNERLNHE